MSTIKSPLRVLVVDDDADQASSLALVLRNYGHHSDVCQYAKDCMAMVERLRPQVILLDLSMPGMTGFDIADELRRNPDLRPAQLVALTGHSQESIKLQVSTTGFDNHLLKPLNFQELQGILETARRIHEIGVLPDSELRPRAYEKWQAAGRPQTDAEERQAFWYAAQRELIAEKIRPK